MLRALVVVLMYLCMAAPLEAQGLRQRISQLFTFVGECGEPLCLPLDPAQHGLHYIPDAVAGNAAILTFIGDAISQSVANIPISGASGGATFTFEGGLPVRTTVSSGPIFAERAPTLGRGRLLMGGNVTYLEFASLRGTPLSGLELNFTHQNVGSPVLGAPFFENDVIQVRTDLEMSLLVTSFFATYGLLDGVDVSVAVPLVTTSLRGTSEAHIFPFPNQPFLPGVLPIHYFGTAESPSLVAHASVDESATGVGDVAVRVKAMLSQSPGLALLADVRLPTGDEENLLGSGALAARGLGILSARLGDFSPHANFGYLYRGGERQLSAVLATVGFDQLLAPWATLAVDFISEWQVGESEIEFPGEVFIEQPFLRRVVPTNIPDRRDDLVNASLGGKFAVSRGANVVVNSLIPINRGGLRPSAAWTVGFEYSF